eukprot:scaffold1655_cov247-Pinguiococcus_pyrenoidosus.AAC.28
MSDGVLSTKAAPKAKPQAEDAHCWAECRVPTSSDPLCRRRALRAFRSRRCRLSRYEEPSISMGMSNFFHLDSLLLRRRPFAGSDSSRGFCGLKLALASMSSRALGPEADARGGPRHRLTEIGIQEGKFVRWDERYSRVRRHSARSVRTTSCGWVKPV